MIFKFKLKMTENCTQNDLFSMLTYGFKTLDSKIYTNNFLTKMVNLIIWMITN